MKRVLSLFFVMLFAFTALAESIPSPSLPAIEDPIPEIAEFLGIDYTPYLKFAADPTMKIHQYYVFCTDEGELAIACIQPNHVEGMSYIVNSNEEMAELLTIIITIHLSGNMPAHIEWGDMRLTEWKIDKIVAFVHMLNI